MKKFFPYILLMLLTTNLYAVEQFVVTSGGKSDFPLIANGLSPSIIVSDADKGVIKAADNLMNDFRAVTGQLPLGYLSNAIIIGTLGQSPVIDNLVKEGKINKKDLEGKREKFIIQTIAKPIAGIEQGLIIAGSDKRGTIYGIYELSAQTGVSPWYWWADVPVAKQDKLFVKQGKYTDGEPAVACRGIFLNDEAPALSGWAFKTFGGFNHAFYEKVFELILRLKGNFLWPAMWGRAFYDDDPENGRLANEMGIIIGTSHHEPMGRAHDEWRRYGNGGAWNYQTNAENLKTFWHDGMERIKDYEKIVTIAMRGDGDEPMSEESNIGLLEKIVGEQRSIIEDVTKKPASETPQVWALYKEVQDYYDKGMRVPDDVTLLLCDDNWGNIRKLPDLDAPKRKGGYGMYYHFDYVGGPRNYKWLNVIQIQRVWEQMNLAYGYGVDKLWVVNVGDLKPMEFPVSFFLDMAWNPDRFNPENLQEYTKQWCARQFGEKYAVEAAQLLNLQNKYIRRVTPELLNEKTYSLENYNEFERVVNDYKELNLRALQLYNLLPAEYRDCFDELVLFPVNTMCNLYEMYFAVAKNHFFGEKNNACEANYWAEKVEEFYKKDSILTAHYHNDIAGGKWNCMMSQTHIGYTNWQQPETQTMPSVTVIAGCDKQSAENKGKRTEKDGYISFEAQNFYHTQGTENIHWETIKDFGKTVSGVMAYPQNIKIQPNDKIYLEYAFENSTVGDMDVHVFLAPTLNFNANKGLRYALSIDGGTETVVNFNGHYRGELGQWQAENLIRSIAKIHIDKAGQHRLRVRVLDSGIVFEKFILDFGGLKPSYLGAPQED